MKFKLFFAWYDCWIGFYWSKESRALYVCLLPMICIKVQFGASDKMWKGIRRAIEEMLARKGGKQ